MPWPGASRTTSKSPLRIASNQGPLGTTRCFTCNPTLLHSSISQVATYLKGWSTLRLSSSKESPSAPASFNSRRASARDFSISGQNPASCSSSSLVARQRRAGKDDPADRLDDCDFRYRRRAVPAVDCQGQCAADPRVVERFALVIGGHRAGDVPVALLDRDLVAERLDELVARRGRHAAEFDSGAVGADRLDPHRLLVGIDSGEAVEIGQPFMVVIGVPLALDRLADLVIDEFERARAEDIPLIPTRILVERSPFGR